MCNPALHTARSVTTDPEGRPAPGRLGFTMVEVMVSVAIFSALTVVGAALMVKTTGFCTEAIFRSDIMESAKIAQERVFDQLFAAKVLSLQWTTPTQPVLTVVVPLELPVGGGAPADFVDATGAINWGALEPTGPKLDKPGDPHRVIITVAASSLLTEKDARLDVNQDGDLLDSFQNGSLMMRTTQGPDVSFLPGRLIVGVGGSGSTDIDGDGAPDPLFQVTGESFTDADKDGMFDEGESFVDANKNGRWDGALSVTILAFSRDRDGRGHRFVYRMSLKLLGDS